MCGIMGYVGPQPVVPILLDGLRRLEYRGYDSAGVAVVNGAKLQVRKALGKLSALERVLAAEELAGSAGVGHTRWATHGVPSEVNAHPHLDCTAGFAVAHNGIIDNFMSLRARLQAEGHRFCSETDTEVIPHLLERYYDGDLLAALRRALGDLEGSYALAVVCAHEPGCIAVARHHSPLIVGLGEGQSWVASDIPALLPYTRETYLLDDGEVALLRADSVSVQTPAGQPVAKPVFHVHWDAAQAAKGGYAHFMLKEIHEQPQALRQTISPRLPGDAVAPVMEGLNLSTESLRQLDQVVIVACGTAYHVGLVAKHALESLARVPVEIDLASELRYRDPVISERSLALVISQSGETADTLAAMRETKRQGARILACTNVVGSSVAREADGLLYTYAGPEIAVASTKAYTSQMAACLLFAIHLGLVRGVLSQARAAELVQALRAIPEQAEAVLSQADEVRRRAEYFLFCRDFLYLGRGPNYASALEGALKLKEISYLHAEGYAAGEMKHGPIALITPQVATIAIALPGRTYTKLLANLQEIRARRGQIIAIAAADDAEIHQYTNYIIALPRTEELLSPLLAALPLQLFAYYCALQLGCDIDQPRNLAKSVTVE